MPVSLSSSKTLYCVILHPLLRLMKGVWQLNDFNILRVNMSYKRYNTVLNTGIYAIFQAFFAQFVFSDVYRHSESLVAVPMKFVINLYRLMVNQSLIKDEGKHEFTYSIYHTFCAYLSITSTSTCTRFVHRDSDASACGSISRRYIK